MNDREIRGGVPAEIRAEDDGIRVSGHAAVFNEEADIYGQFREVIRPGAFREAIKRDDVVFLVNHEGLPLARTRSKTLNLTEDDKGLRMETTLDPEDPDVRAIVGKMKRGDLDKMSFAFRATQQKLTEPDDPEELVLREILEVELFDVAIVTTPAYEGTDIGLRSIEKLREQIRRTENFHAARRRKMLREIMERDLALRERENG